MSRYFEMQKLNKFAISVLPVKFLKAFREYQQPESSLEDSMDDGESDDELAATESDMAVEHADVHTILTDSVNDESSAFLPKHIRCASHTLNLLATTDFKTLVSDESMGCKRLLRSAFAKCSSLWNNVSRSTKSSDAAVDIIATSLRTPGETRWNSTFDAVKRLLEPRVCTKLPQLMETLKLPQFSKIELEVLDEYVKYMALLLLPWTDSRVKVNAFSGYLCRRSNRYRRKLTLAQLHCSTVVFWHKHCQRLWRRGFQWYSAIQLKVRCSPQLLHVIPNLSCGGSATIEKNLSRRLFFLNARR